MWLNQINLTTISDNIIEETGNLAVLKYKEFERLKKRGSIFFEKKLGIITFKTDIYLMVNK